MLTQLCLFCLAVCASAWGAITHYSWGCDVINQPFDECLRNTSNKAFRLGLDLPDAFFFGDTLQGYDCSGYPVLHDAIYAGLMLREAQKNKDKDAEMFAIGYGLHCMADKAGFSPGGYLIGNERTVEWLAMWRFMGAVDTYIWDTANFSAGLPPPPESLPKSFATLLATQSIELHKLSPIAPTVNETTATLCSAGWEMTLTQLRKIYQIDSKSYEKELIAFDNYGAKTFPQVQEHLKLAGNCAVLIGKYWLAQLGKGASPLAAVSAATAYTGSLFKAGKCSPTKRAF